MEKEQKLSGETNTLYTFLSRWQDSPNISLASPSSNNSIATRVTYFRLEWVVHDAAKRSCRKAICPILLSSAAVWLGNVRK